MLRDREHLRRFRWQTSDAQRQRYMEALDQALEIATKAGNAREVRGCVRTLAVLEQMNQADEHLALRLATGAMHDGEIRVVVEHERLPTAIERDGEVTCP
jgi:hypothetical protein